MSKLKRAKKYLDMIPDELRDNPNVSFEIRYLVQLLAAMTAKVEELEGANRWIAVEERLPDGGYLVAHVVAKWYADGHAPVLCMYNGNWIDFDLQVISGEVTHWMPLPTPPEQSDAK